MTTWLRCAWFAPSSRRYTWCTPPRSPQRPSRTSSTRWRRWLPTSPLRARWLWPPRRTPRCNTSSSRRRSRHSRRRVQLSRSRTLELVRSRCGAARSATPRAKLPRPKCAVVIAAAAPAAPTVPTARSLCASPNACITTRARVPSPRTATAYDPRARAPRRRKTTHSTSHSSLSRCGPSRPQRVSSERGRRSRQRTSSKTSCLGCERYAGTASAAESQREPPQRSAGQWYAPHSASAPSKPTAAARRRHREY
mmetsp:Transcript_18753/g.61232  ORF Transcript_18753/g.61232 Transcript_18753/m.61232 type:complete len:252 (+) Transcript_18753:1008-1763(+)